jgi:hypothetical protein
MVVAVVVLAMDRTLLQILDMVKMVVVVVEVV